MVLSLIMLSYEINPKKFDYGIVRAPKLGLLPPGVSKANWPYRNLIGGLTNALVCSVRQSDERTRSY